MQPYDNDLDATFGCLTAPAVAELAAGLAELTGLDEAERQALLAGATASITEVVGRKVSRLLLLELNAARVTHQLGAEDAAGRYAEFITRASTLDFWLSLELHYPTLLPRLATVIGNRANAALELGRRFAANRGQLAALASDAQPHLTAVTFGEGDSHRGGRTVALLELASQTVVYKPRSLQIDAALEDFLERLFDGAPAADRIHVPAVLTCGNYGWSDFVEHRLCETAAELATYYTRLGHWLAMARLFGTTDLHAENMIACGPTPVLIDCETLFTPLRTIKPLGAGDALDRAAAMLTGTVLSSGLLPNRGVSLGWRGVDISASGALPEQQPMVQVPQILDAGTDRARLGMGTVPGMTARNLPSTKPDLDRYWPQVLAGFDELTGRLHELDRAGWLTGALAGFGDVDIRAVLRSTESYAELARMLWHPVSLHDEPAAVERATALLVKHAAAAPTAPSDPAVIAAEIADLLVGDVPFFQTSTATGWLLGPRDTGWGKPHDVLADTLSSWRVADFDVEREVIRSSVVCAYINDGYLPGGKPLPVEPVADGDAQRRHRLAAGILERLVKTAIRGDDGTATWIAPVMNVTGWSVQPLSPDGYSGAPGVALLLAGYLREVEEGRADPVPGLPELLSATVATMQAADNFRLAERQAGYPSRPDTPGLYVGIGSQIWCWTELATLGAVSSAEAVRRSAMLAELLPESLAATTETDLLKGSAGAIVTLLRLADLTADERWLELAVETGRQLVESRFEEDGQARWPSELWPAGLGGFGHGATGIGWALARLGARTGRAEFLRVAEAAFAFEETLWIPAEGGWRDAREQTGIATAWCHGATGIGLASVDLIKRGLAGNTDHASVIRRAAQSCWYRGMGWNHTVCHGDLGCWELLTAAIELGLAPDGLDQNSLDAYVVSSVERHGPISGLARAAFVPGLMPGLSGVAYQLLRLDPRCSLPSVLLID